MISQCHTDLLNPHFHHNVSTGKKGHYVLTVSPLQKKKRKKECSFTLPHTQLSI